MPKEEQTNSVSRKEFYAAVGLLWSFIIALSIVIFGLADGPLQRAGTFVLMLAAAAAGLLYVIRGLRAPGRPAPEKDRSA